MERLSPLGRVMLAAFAAALAARLVALGLLGPRFGGDSVHYLGLAEALRSGGLAALGTLDVVSSPLYPVFIALIGGLTPDLVAAATGGQVGLGALTAALAARITHRVSGSLPAAAVGGAVAAFLPSSIFWGTYVLTETLFVCALAVCADRLVALSSTRRPFLDGLGVGATALLVLLARPTGAPFLVVIPIYVWLALRGRPAVLARAASGGAAVIVLGIVGALALQARIPGYDLAGRISAYVWSAVYFGLQWNEHGRGTAGVDIVGGPPDGDARAAVFAWIEADPMYPVLQALRKLKMFWTPVLPEFSLRHAAFALAFYIPYYVLAVAGFRALRHHGTDLILLLGGVAAFTVTAMVTFVDYDQRFRLPAEMLLVPLVAVGATRVLPGLTAMWSPRAPGGAAARAARTRQP